jgi:hypothetical protein
MMSCFFTKAAAALFGWSPADLHMTMGKRGHQQIERILPTFPEALPGEISMPNFRNFFDAKHTKFLLWDRPVGYPFRPA